MNIAIASDIKMYITSYDHRGHIVQALNSSDKIFVEKMEYIVNTGVGKACLHLCTCSINAYGYDIPHTRNVYLLEDGQILSGLLMSDVERVL
jgi:hypothetical protein